MTDLDLMETPMFVFLGVSSALAWTYLIALAIVRSRRARRRETYTAPRGVVHVPITLGLKRK